MATTLPSLHYTLHTRIRSIALVWSALIIITSIQVLFFYFILRYAAHTKVDVSLTVPTAILLALSILSIGFRTWKLMRKGSKCRPVGGKWWGLDYFHINAIVGFVIVTAVLAHATGADPPNLRQSSLPQSIVLFLAGSQLLMTGALSHFRIPAPFPLSSTSRGTVTRPGVFVLVEDIVAVDGSGGTEFREKLLERYGASEVFARDLKRLNWFWGVGSVAVAGATVGCVYGIENEDVGFALGWSIPWVWAAASAGVTVLWVKKMLRQEAEKGHQAGESPVMTETVNVTV